MAGDPQSPHSCCSSRRHDTCAIPLFPTPPFLGFSIRGIFDMPSSYSCPPADVRIQHARNVNVSRSPYIQQSRALPSLPLSSSRRAHILTLLMSSRSSYTQYLRISSRIHPPPPGDSRDFFPPLGFIRSFLLGLRKRVRYGLASVDGADEDEESSAGDDEA